MNSSDKLIINCAFADKQSSQHNSEFNQLMGDGDKQVGRDGNALALARPQLGQKS